MGDPRLDLVQLLRRTIARGGSLSLSQQLRSVFEVAAAEGQLRDGLQLPSVRRLASELGLAPNTVVRAYKQLEAEGLVRVVPRLGYFIAASTDAPSTPARTHVQGLIDEAIRAAERAGIDTIKFLQLVSAQIKVRKERGYVIAVVGDRDAALERRIEAVRRTLRDFSVDVIGLSFEELATPAGSERATGVDSYLVPMLDTERAAEALGPHAYRILPMYLTLSASARSFIASRRADTHFGVIVTRDAYQARMATALRRIHSPGARISTASVDNRAAVDRVVREADVLLVASAAQARLPIDLALRQPMMELLFLPDEETLHRIRAIVAAERLLSRSASHLDARGRTTRVMKSSPTQSRQASGRAE